VATKNCVICGASAQMFGSQITCSPECSIVRKRQRTNDWGKVRRYCVECGSAFMVCRYHPCRKGYGRKVFCSAKCSKKALSRKLQAKRDAARVLGTCVVCGEKFKRRGKKLTCSVECSAIKNKQYHARAAFLRRSTRRKCCICQRPIPMVVASCNSRCGRIECDRAAYFRHLESKRAKSIRITKVCNECGMAFRAVTSSQKCAECRQANSMSRLRGRKERRRMHADVATGTISYLQRKGHL